MSEAEADEGQWYTTITCPRCKVEVDGIQHHYYCKHCEWISPPDGPAEPADT